MKRYKQLSLLEREQIFGLRKEKLSFREIGRRLNRPHTTLTREFLRNAKYGQSYIPSRLVQTDFLKKLGIVKSG